MSILEGQDPTGPAKSKLSKREILRGHQTFSHILSKGRETAGNHLRAYALATDSKLNAGVSVRIGFAVTRRVRSAVLRNRVRRMMREAYRKSKATWIGSAKERGQFWRIIVMYRGDDVRAIKKLKYLDIERDMQQILKKVVGSP